MKKLKYVGILLGTSLAISLAFAVCARFLFKNLIVGIVVCVVSFIALVIAFDRSLRTPQKPIKIVKDENGKPILKNNKYVGTKENPEVVGDPEHSTTLVYDEKNDRWILTDGLGNGWIR